jgi:glutamine amidotransferase
VSGPAIAVVDYGMGNRRSVEKALARVGARAAVTRDHDALRTADGLVVPGVGAFPKAMHNLHELGLDELIAERLEAGTPVLGICLGMQLLFDSSTELGGAEGLGLVPGPVTELDPRGAKLPHIGWNLVTWERPSSLTDGLPAACAFYHVHSLVPRPADPADVLGVSEYGEPFATAIDASERAGAPLFGVQFHPEKSSAHGLKLLENFSAICARVAA